ncbi:MAG: hypothetical protein AB1696_00835 [Planctomycetota bacterium]
MMFPEVIEISESSSADRLRWWNWWPMLLGPADMLFVCLARRLGWTWFLSKGLHEALGTHLTAAAAGCYLLLAWRSGNPVHKLLAALSIAFLCREIHFAGTTHGVYAALALLVLWAWLWRGRLKTGAAEGRLLVWLCATAFTYILSELVARNILRVVGIHYGLEMRCWTEESLESMAHVMLIITAFSDRFRRPKVSP